LGAAGLRAGLDEDEIIAQELGVDSLSDTQERYKEKIRLKLEQVRGLPSFLHAPCGPCML
jgi:hypothetical protein